MPRLQLAVLATCAVLGAGCPAFELAPCFPATSASSTPLSEAEGGMSRKTLEWEIDKMAALVDAPESDDPPSEVYARAQRDMRTEFWTDAARGFLTVVRGDTPDGKKVRLQAQYFFAVTLYRLRYYTEARRIFSLVAADGKHPLNREAGDWMQRRVCSG